MTAYYNEIDPYAAAWLRNLIDAGHIARGDVDERSIADVKPGDLRGYRQCHFFAGIGGWSLALRLAGWPDDRPVWTGSCPCQPFSAAGKGEAFNDERHLWPAWFSLIRECAPAVVFGEQVEAAIGWGWLDAVFADLEAEGYACGAAVLPACGVGAPHIRQRLWFVGFSERHNMGRVSGSALGEEAQGSCSGQVDGACGVVLGPTSAVGELADAHEGQRGRLADGEGCERDRKTTGRQQSDSLAQSGGVVRELAVSESQQLDGSRDARRRRRQPANDGLMGHADDARPQGRGVPGTDPRGGRSR